MTTAPGQHDESLHPRAGDGKFATKTVAEAGEVDLAPTTAGPVVALTPREVEHLVESKGRFADGYTSEDIDSFAGSFTSARLTCVWDDYDDMGYCGNSEIVGRALASEPSGAYGAGRHVDVEKGAYRRLHPDVVDFLFERDSDVDPEQIPSLLADEATDGSTPDEAVTENGFHNVAVSDSTRTVCEGCGDPTEEKDSHGTLMCAECQDDGSQCREDGCDLSTDDGDGYDGYCATHADLITAHDEGEHAKPNVECPVC